MKFELGQIQKILGCDAATESKWLDPINKACEKFGINTKLRLAAFIAQVGHESGRLSTVVENLNYSASGLTSTWPSRFDAASANAAARNPEKIANTVYADRMGNGSYNSGDGWKYRGRGLIQCTGKSNYDAFSQSCGVNAVSKPDLLTSPEYAALSAGWFWSSKGLNAYADRGDFIGTTKRINGGTIGQAERELLYKRALLVLDGKEVPKDSVLAKKPIEVSPDSSANPTDEKTPAAQNSSIVEPRANSGSGGTSQYPWNLVYESRSGHTYETDDTPGNERITMAHRTGSYWEVDKVGTMTHKSILDSYKLTKEDSYDYTGGNYTQQVKGQSYRQSTGDMIFKTDGQVFMNANKVQVNTGLMAVSGEIDAPNINANIFAGMSGMAFGDLLAKEAIVAYDLKKGKAPILGGSMGFRSSNASSASGGSDGNGSDDGSNSGGSNGGSDGGGSGDDSDGSGSGTNGGSSNGSGSGSADNAMDNNLSTNAPDGTPWITNGIKAIAGLAGIAAAASAIADIFKTSDPDKTVKNALTSAAQELNAGTKEESLQTPVFLKHVTFNKPTLLSMSTTINKPDPSIYVNNIHTIVDAKGVGKVYISDGKQWIPVGDPSESNHYTDHQIGQVRDELEDLGNKTIDEITKEAQARSDAIAKEALERANAILNEARERDEAFVNEAQTRQNAISQAILTEAAARKASVEAESIIRQTEDESLSNHILSLTASVSDDIAAAIRTEQQARADAISSEATLRQVLASKVDDVVSSVSDEITARTNGDTSITQRLTEYISSNDNALAAAKTSILTQVDANNVAVTTRIDALVSQTNEDITAAVRTEAQTRTDEDSALSSRIDSVEAYTENTASIVNTEIQTRADADSALSTRIDTVFSKTNANESLIATEVQARTDQDSALASRIDSLVTTVGLNTSAITNEAKTRADGDSATALSIQNLSSRVGDDIATVTQFATATSNALGDVKAQWGIKTNANGSVAGIALVSDLVEGKPVSSFTIQADKFLVESPAGNKTPFGVDSNGVFINGTVRINANGTTLNDISTAGSFPLTFVGSFSTAPSNGVKNQVYANTSDGNSYIYNGSAWVLFIKKGDSGTTGPRGFSGSDGTRGSVTAYGNGSWSDTTANNVILSVTGSSTKVIGDTVTLSNSSSATTKYWSGGSWVDPGVVINGNLLVSGTLSASKIFGGTLSGVTCSIGPSAEFQVASNGWVTSAKATLLCGTAGNLYDPTQPAFKAQTVGFSTQPAIYAGAQSGGDAIIIAGSGNGLNQYGGGVNYLRTVYPTADNSWALGSPSLRWNQICAANSTIVTSDERVKTDVEDSPIGLSFIESLRPVKYKLIVGKNKVEEINLDEGIDVGPIREPKTISTEVPGKRNHYGLIAQEVRKAMDDHGIDDAAFWGMADAEDLDSQQFLRYEELISPLIKAVQELSAEVKSLRARVAELEG